MAPIKKAVGGHHTTTTAIMKAESNIAPSRKKRYPALKRCATFVPGASNTIEIAGNLPDSEVFSRPEFNDGPKFRRIHGFGRDGLVRKAGRMAISMLLTSRPPVARSKAASGLQSQIGAETMTKVNTPTTSKLDTIARQQAIENALSTALYFIRLPSTESGLKAATGRAIRATAMLKQACAEQAIGSAS
ncbi:MAG: hypothetical protein JWR68_3408 [Polaromonas sp.]|nr:hypothetical protein [Polaromonas sp.]